MCIRAHEIAETTKSLNPLRGWVGGPQLVMVYKSGCNHYPHGLHTNRMRYPIFEVGRYFEGIAIFRRSFELLHRHAGEDQSRLTLPGLRIFGADAA